MNEGQIQTRIFKEFKQDVIIPNVYWNNSRWEMDIARITKSNYVYEYEIKTSVADFKNEKRKRKHVMYGKLTTKTLHLIPNYFSVVTDCKDITKDMVEKLSPRYGLVLVGPRKWKVLRRGTRIKPDACTVDFRKLTRKMCFKLFNNVERFK